MKTLIKNAHLIVDENTEYNNIDLYIDQVVSLLESYLSDYIKSDKTARELADGLTLSGSHVESIYSLNKGVENNVF